MKPNNFPREGMHSPVTRDAVKKLERERPVLNTERHFTIGGEIETVVHSNLYAEREAAITNGARSLNRASDRLYKATEALKPDPRTKYIREQREAARPPEREQRQSVRQSKPITR